MPWGNFERGCESRKYMNIGKYKVGDKFVIEIEGIYENVLSGVDIFEAVTSEPLYRIKGFNSLVFDKNGLDKIEKIKPTLPVPYSEAYEKGMNDTWDIARELCKTGYSECTEIFGDETVEHVIKNYMPFEVKEKIDYFKKDREIHIGDKVQDCDHNTKAIILDKEDWGDEHENEWIVYTENGYVESWYECDIKKINERVDLSKLFI